MTNPNPNRYSAVYVTPSGRELPAEFRGMTPGGMARLWFPDGASMTTPMGTVRTA
jgi:hypothetical protein